MEIRVGEVELQVGETIRHGFRGGKTAALNEQFNQGLEGGMELFSGGGKLGCDLGGSSFHDGEDQFSLRAKALDQGGGADASFPADICQGELGRPQALHDAGGGSEDFCVGSFAGAGRHFSIGPHCGAARVRIAECRFRIHLTLLNGRL